jgi:hypothetical protein
MYNEKALCKLGQVIFKLHKEMPYKEIQETIEEMQKRLSIMAYVEEWMKEFNPEGLRFIN